MFFNVDISVGIIPVHFDMSFLTYTCIWEDDVSEL